MSDADTGCCFLRVAPAGQLLFSGAKRRESSACSSKERHRLRHRQARLLRYPAPDKRKDVAVRIDRFSDARYFNHPDVRFQQTDGSCP